MLAVLPTTVQDFMNWEWSQIEPYYAELNDRPIAADTVAGWLSDWTKLANLLSEAYSRLAVAVTVNTADEAAEARYNNYLDNIMPARQTWEQKLRQKLLDSKLEPAGFVIPMRNIRAESELFRDANLPLFVQEAKLNTEYDKIVGAQMVEWEGQELTTTQLAGKMPDLDRPAREKAWCLIMGRWQTDRPAINEIWKKFLPLRKQIAANAGFDNYRDYRWRALLRFDYTPDDALRFHAAIEEVVVPLVTKLRQKYAAERGVGVLRPWDLSRDHRNVITTPPLHPYNTVTELEDKATAMFKQVDPQFGTYFGTMRQDGLLDLENRKGKAPGGYCTHFPVAQRPFIFMNAVGLHDDVQTLLHEAGHAFHAFETFKLPYYQQQEYPMEIAEVASMSMELLAAPYLTVQNGGFYSEKDAARARIEHLEDLVTFWPFMAVVDAFQHWVYTSGDAALDTNACDAKWAELWKRFIPAQDWSGLDQEMMSGWHRKLHIFGAPFYYIEYGLAQLGAVQIWRNSLHDQKEATQAYRKALSLGYTVPLPQLYEAAGAKLAFDTGTLGAAVALIERTLDELHEIIAKA